MHAENGRHGRRVAGGAGFLLLVLFASGARATDCARTESNSAVAHTTVTPTALVGVRIGRRVELVFGADLAVARWLTGPPRLLGGYARTLVVDAGSGSVLDLEFGAAVAPWERAPSGDCDPGRPLTPTARLGFGLEPGTGAMSARFSGLLSAFFAAGAGVSIPLSGQGFEATLLLGLGWTFVR